MALNWFGISIMLKVDWLTESSLLLLLLLLDLPLQRLVKCRLRSEIEARKAVESTMKRAVQEARELKKELVLLRQEKEERARLPRRARAVVATSPLGIGRTTPRPESRAAARLRSSS